MLSAKQRDSNLQVLDDVLPPYTQRNTGKASSARKSSETDHSLPIPLHVRAASTPAHMETPRTELVHNHKRYPSCVETSPRKEAKKYSADNYVVRNDDRHSKRAMSESKDKITKRNASSPAAISLLSADKLHRADDRGKSPVKQNTLPMKASPELLAELLRGSSEKMTTSERERNRKLVHVDAYTLPMAVQQFAVSVFFTTLNIHRRLGFDMHCSGKASEVSNLQLEIKYKLPHGDAVQTNMTYSTCESFVFRFGWRYFPICGSRMQILFT